MSQNTPSGAPEGDALATLVTLVEAALLSADHDPNPQLGKSLIEPDGEWLDDVTERMREMVHEIEDEEDLELLASLGEAAIAISEDERVALSAPPQEFISAMQSRIIARLSSEDSHRHVPEEKGGQVSDKSSPQEPRSGADSPVDSCPASGESGEAPQRLGAHRAVDRPGVAARSVTRGVLFVHSAPRALCPHIEWAAGGVLGVRLSLDWIPQPAAPGMYRTELSWQAEQGTGARLTSALRGWAQLRYEVSEEPSAGADGGRWSHTPELGIFHAMADVHGNVVVPGDRIRAALEAASGDGVVLVRELDLALGTAWDDELEPFRHVVDGAPVRWLHPFGSVMRGAGSVTRGVLFVHSAPRALCPHIEWAAGGVLGERLSLDWIPQPAAPGMYRTELSWQAEQGTGARLTSALRGWAHLRYEVSEEPSAGADGGRWSYTPELGIFHAVTDVHGNVVVPEDRIRAALEAASGDGVVLVRELDLALGTAWDDELVPFRYAAEKQASKPSTQQIVS